MAKAKCADGRRFNRPPVASQFKPGQSGNPRGKRPAASLETLARDACRGSLLEIVGERDGQKVTALEGVLLKLRNKALGGDLRAADKLFALCERYKALVPAKEDPNGAVTSGVLVVPTISSNGEEWERDHGEAAKGKPPPREVAANSNVPAPKPAIKKAEPMRAFGLD